MNSASAPACTNLYQTHTSPTIFFILSRDSLSSASCPNLSMIRCLLAYNLYTYVVTRKGNACILGQEENPAGRKRRDNSSGVIMQIQFPALSLSVHHVNFSQSFLVLISHASYAQPPPRLVLRFTQAVPFLLATLPPSEKKRTGFIALLAAGLYSCFMFHTYWRQRGNRKSSGVPQLRRVYLHTAVKAERPKAGRCWVVEEIKRRVDATWQFQKQNTICVFLSKTYRLSPPLSQNYGTTIILRNK